MNKKCQLATLAAAIVALTAILGAARPAKAGSYLYEIQFDTAAAGLASGSGGLIQLALIPATAPSPASVTAVVYGASPAADVGAIESTFSSGDISGDLSGGGSVTLANDDSSQQVQDFTVTSFFDVFVEISGTEVGPGASGTDTGTELYVTLYDNGSDAATAILQVNPNGMLDGTIQPAVAINGMFETGDTGVTITMVPEPSALVMQCVGLAAAITLGYARAKRRTAFL